MVLDRNKLAIALARKAMNISDLYSVLSRGTLTKVNAGHSVSLKTAGKIAQALGVDILDIIKEV